MSLTMHWFEAAKSHNEERRCQIFEAGIWQETVNKLSYGGLTCNNYIGLLFIPPKTFSCIALTASSSWRPLELRQSMSVCQVSWVGSASLNHLPIIQSKQSPLSAGYFSRISSRAIPSSSPTFSSSPRSYHSWVAWGLTYLLMSFLLGFWSWAAKHLHCCKNLYIDLAS